MLNIGINIFGICGSVLTLVSATLSIIHDDVVYGLVWWLVGSILVATNATFLIADVRDFNRE